MPENFAPEWEYYTPDPEVEWLFARTALIRGDFAALDLDRGGYGTAARNHGLIFGCGNPNHLRTHLAPEKPERAARERPARVCCRPGCGGLVAEAGRAYCSRVCYSLDTAAPRLTCVRAGCGATFRTRQPNRRHCSAACRLTPPRPCAACAVEFRPRRAGRRHCRDCRQGRAGRPVTLVPVACGTCGKTFRPDHAARKFCSVACVPKIATPAPDAERLELFRQGWTAGEPVAALAARLGVHRATLGLWRRRLNLPRRPKGGAGPAAVRWARLES